MKETICFIAAPVLLFSLALSSCGEPKKPEQPAPEPAPITSTQPQAQNAIPQGPGVSTEEIHPRVTQIDVSRGWASAYLIRGEKIAIVNTGPKQPVEVYIGPALEKLDLTPADIDIILDTCIHGDHIGGNEALQSASNAPVYIYAEDADHLENFELFIDTYMVPDIEELLGKEQVETQKAAFLASMPHDLTVGRRLRDGDIIELGEGVNLKVLHLPGHTPWDVGYYWEEEGILFAGDTVKGVHGARGALPVINDLDKYEKSIERLLELPLKVMARFHPAESITIPNTFILRDGEIKQFLQEILGTIPVMREAAESIAPAYPEKPFWELYDDFINLLPSEWKLSPASAMPQVPFHGGVTFLNLIKKITKEMQ